MNTMVASWFSRGGRLAVAFVGLSATTFAAAQTAAEPIDIELSTGSGVAGDSIEVGISLHTKAHDVGGIQIDIQADPPLAIGITEAGRPDCWRNTDLNKDYTVYAFPARADGQWNYMRALVLSLTNVDAIPDGALLFTCRVHIDADAEPGDYQLLASRLLGGTPQGEEIAAVSSGGLVLVEGQDEGSLPLLEGTTSQASGGCAIGSVAPGTGSALLLGWPLILWGFRRNARRTHE